VSEKRKLRIDRACPALLPWLQKRPCRFAAAHPRRPPLNVIMTEADRFARRVTSVCVDGIQVVAGAAKVSPIIISPIAAIQPPKARSTMARQAVRSPPSARRNVTTSAMVKVITA